MLKGAMLFARWSGKPFRAIGDLDLLSLGSAGKRYAQSMVADVAAMRVEPNGEARKGRAAMANVRKAARP